VPLGPQEFRFDGQDSSVSKFWRILLRAIRGGQAQIFGATFSGEFSVKLPKN
jgi:hypothetical protein